MEELKPCPFCGGEAEIIIRGTYNNPMHIGCKSCHAKIVNGDIYGLTKPKDYGWNQRVKLREKEK